MDVPSAVKYVTQKQYEHLRSTVPYTEGIDEARAFHYLKWSKKLSKVMQPMIDHSAMGVLIQLIEENIPDYTPSENCGDSPVTFLYGIQYQILSVS